MAVGNQCFFKRKIPKEFNNDIITFHHLRVKERKMFAHVVKLLRVRNVAAEIPSYKQT